MVGTRLGKDIINGFELIEYYRRNEMRFQKFVY